MIVVEEFRTNGSICGSHNTTFIALIPKSSWPETYSDFRPISICNLVYKIISKTIANIINPFLDRAISKEQFVFFYNKWILDATKLAQESLHSVKFKKLKDLIFKMDLIRSYDKVYWTFLRLILHHIGLNSEAINWIMGCVTSTTFNVLINGSPTTYFKSHRGLRKGYPLSPLIFLFFIEGFSRFVGKAMNEGRLYSLNLITHLLFFMMLFCLERDLLRNEIISWTN